MQTWRLVDSTTYDPFYNLSIEEAILRSVGKGHSPNTIRFWCNSSCIIVGFSQHVESEVKIDVCRKMKIPIVRRFTGGGTVYQDLGNLNFSVIVNRGHSLFSNDIIKSYEVVARGVMKGMELLGLEATFSVNEILLNNKKISGMAGANQFGACIRHGTLLVDTDPHIIKKVLKNLKKEVTNLNMYFTKKLTINDVKEALTSGFEEEFSIKLEKRNITIEEIKTAMKLYDEKYSLDEWNYACARGCRRPKNLEELAQMK